MRKPFQTRPDITGHFGVAASTHWLAAQTAMRMLELGGNAFDAAVAAGFVLQVAEPHLNGPLGEVPILLYDASKSQTRVICGQGPAPAKATIGFFQDQGIEQIPGTGLLAAAVPGAFDAWMLLLRDYGTLDLATVLDPAISYAEHGVPVLPRLADAISVMKSWFETYWPENAKIYLPAGDVPEVGSQLKNLQLAATWTRLLREVGAETDRQGQIDRARDVWKTGFVADAIVDFCAGGRFMDVTGCANGGLIEAADLAKWSARYEEPVSIDFGAYQIFKCGPWSQGPVLLQSLRLLEAAGLQALEDDTSFYHYTAEAMKLAYADRETFYGDPDFVDVPLQQLLSREYAAQRTASIGKGANNCWNPGKITGFGHAIDYEAACNIALDDDALAALGIGEPTVADHGKISEITNGDTCHINVIDRWGNMVAATPSGGWMESSPVIPELGFCLGTRLQMMRLDPGAPDALAPGKRPRTTLSPTLVLNANGSGYMACGTPGGDKQDQWQVLFLLRHLVLGQTPQEAIEAPLMFSSHWPDSFFPRQASRGKITIEGRIGKGVAKALRDKGHDLQIASDWSDGYVTASFIRPGGTLGSAASPRGQQAYAIGR
ncbi:MAG: gamma-glutamyltransferase family protein [Pseudomonadota bacterium]